MKGGRILLICFLMCFITGSGLFWLTQSQLKKVCVVDAVKLFDGFNMKKELEEKAKIKLQSISGRIDSIDNALQMAKAAKNEEEIKKLMYAQSYMKNFLENEYQQSNTDINAQVWKRLNPILDEYGKKKGLRLIIGANGMGSVLYVDAYYDLTEELIKYSNKRYEEGN